MTTNQLTFAGAAVSLAVLFLNLRPWWKGGRDPKQLIPFGSAFILGALATVCTGGLLGWLAGCSAVGANTAGNKAVPGTTGTPDSVLARGSMGQLTAEGGVVVFLLAIGVAAAWKAAGKSDKRRMFGGGFCGMTLCLTAGIAGTLDFLPGVANSLGAGLRGALEGGGLL